MKFSSFIWDMYKNSDQGKRVINSFKPQSEEQDMWKHIELYNKEYFITYSGNRTELLNDIEESTYYDIVNNNDVVPTDIIEAQNVFKSILDFGVYDNGVHVIERQDYKIMLEFTTPISYALYNFSAEYFFPNLFPLNFNILLQIFDGYELELPDIPIKSDYKARCLYYFDLCRVFHDFRTKFELLPEELCAFLYDFAPQALLEPSSEIETSKAIRAWMIGGKLPSNTGCNLFWQVNKEVQRGDLLIFYEKAPISAINCIFTASSKGQTDPFFHYYGFGYIGNRINTPQITIEEFKNDDYFSKHPLIKKNFQGVNGWAITSIDYNELLRIISQKGFDISTLPKLYRPEINLAVELRVCLRIFDSKY